MQTFEFEVNDFKATVIIPDNPNGKWIWKTEFFFAFDQAERSLLDMGYTRVYYQINDMYGSKRAVKLMANFHDVLLKKFPMLDSKPYLFGFSRGGLYAFNYALTYPKRVNKIYLDAPVLNLKSWPKNGSNEQKQFIKEYNIVDLDAFCDSPIDHLDEFFTYNIPTFIVAGDSDEIVPFSENGQIMIDKATKLKQDVKYILKKGCGHHPHSLKDVTPIVDFIIK